MRYWISTVLPLAALLGGCANTTTGPASTDEPLYMQMTDEDVRLADTTLQRALETQISGVTVYWRNGATGHYGAVTPERTYNTAGGTYCRAYREQISVVERSATYTDRACRNSDGIWIAI